MARGSIRHYVTPRDLMIIDEHAFREQRCRGPRCTLIVNRRYRAAKHGRIRVNCLEPCGRNVARVVP